MSILKWRHSVSIMSYLHNTSCLLGKCTVVVLNIMVLDGSSREYSLSTYLIPKLTQNSVISLSTVGNLIKTSHFVLNVHTNLTYAALYELRRHWMGEVENININNCYQIREQMFQLSVLFILLVHCKKRGKFGRAFLFNNTIPQITLTRYGQKLSNPSATVTVCWPDCRHSTKAEIYILMDPEKGWWIQGGSFCSVAITSIEHNERGTKGILQL